MTGPAMQFLRAQRRDVTAAEIARALGIPREDVYAELVPAESRGLARMAAHEKGGRKSVTWAALEKDS